MNISKLALGTAQLGFNYGIANINGKPDKNSAMHILDYAYNNGITTFDTAPVYGNSEEILGEFISKKRKKDHKVPIIISKLKSFSRMEEHKFETLYDYIKVQINLSLAKLKIEKMPIFLIHHVPDILYKDGLIIEVLTQIKKEGLVDNIGVSIYNPEDVKLCLNFRDLKVVQIPINIFDHRLIKMGLLNELKKKAFIILARSIYLQGLFFLNPKDLPENLNLAKEYLKKLNNIADEYKFSITKLAFLFIRDIPEINSMVIGAEKIEQVMENLLLLREKPLSREIQKRILEEFHEVPEKIVNPSLWNK